MRDDYLWDGSGPPSPDVRGLEELLAPLGYRAQPFAPPARVAQRPLVARRWFPLFALAASSLALALLVWARSGAPSRRQTVVTVADGSTPDAGPADGND